MSVLRFKLSASHKKCREDLEALGNTNETHATAAVEDAGAALHAQHAAAKEALRVATLNEERLKAEAKVIATAATTAENAFKQQYALLEKLNARTQALDAENNGQRANDLNSLMTQVTKRWLINDYCFIIKRI